MRLLLDINVLLDVALKRAPFAHDSAQQLNAVVLGQAEGFVASHTLTTAFYVIAKNQGVLNATAVVAQMLRILDVVPADRVDLSQAVSLGWRDFEDAVQAVSALKIGADYIVTRDLHDFRAASTPAHPPSHVLTLL